MGKELYIVIGVLSFILLSNFVKADVKTVTILTYDFEDATTYAANYSEPSANAWERATGRGRTDSAYAAVYEGARSDADEILEYTPSLVLSYYESCYITSWMYAEAGIDTGDFICFDYYANTAWDKTTGGDGSGGTCIDGDVDTEDAWTEFSHNLTTTYDDVRFRWRTQTGATAEETIADDVSVVCYTDSPTYTVDLADVQDPVIVGDDVNYTATGTDVQSENYYLKVCSTDSISNGACAGTTYCTSSNVSSGSQASCTYTTSSAGTLTGYGFLCDVMHYCSASQTETTTVNNPFGNLSVILYSPTDNFNIGQGNLFNMSVNVSCEGVAGAVCNTVNAHALYNLSSAIIDFPINNTNSTTLPFGIVGGGVTQQIYYNYSGITYPTSTHNATTFVNQPGINLSKWEIDDTQLTTDEYDKIRNLNGSTISNSGDQYGMVFRYVLNEQSTSVSNILFDIAGYGSDGTLSPPTRFEMYVWNGTKWIYATEHPPGTNTVTSLKYNITSPLGYIDENNVVSVFVLGGVAGIGPGTFVLSTANMTITSTGVPNPYTIQLSQGESFIYNWTINATGAPGSYEVGVYANSSSGDVVNSSYAQNTVIITGGSPPAGDSCTYGGTGTWYLNLSDNCIIGDLQNATGQEVYIQGDGGGGSLIINQTGYIIAESIHFLPRSFSGNIMYAILKGGRVLTRKTSGPPVLPP